jgi:hypothetical protein
VCLSFQLLVRLFQGQILLHHQVLLLRHKKIKVTARPFVNQLVTRTVASVRSGSPYLFYGLVL